MSKKWAMLLGLAMLALAVGFILFAIRHPEGAFPWSNTVTYTIYGTYCGIMALLLAVSVWRR